MSFGRRRGRRERESVKISLSFQFPHPRVSLTPGAEEKGEDKLKTTQRRKNGYRLRGRKCNVVLGRDETENKLGSNGERIYFLPRKPGPLRSLTLGFSSEISLSNVGN